MSKKLLVTADLGHLKVFRLEEDGEQLSKPRATLLEEEITGVRNHLSEEVTDRAGQFRKGSFPAGPTDRSDGEEHNLSLERRRRALKGIAKHISDSVQREGVEKWYLAAQKEINEALVSALERKARARLEKNVKLNLTKLKMEEVLTHFCGENKGKYVETKMPPNRRRNANGRRDVTLQHVQSMAAEATHKESRDLKDADQRLLNEGPARGRSSPGALNRSNVRLMPSARRTRWPRRSTPR